MKGRKTIRTSYTEYASAGDLTPEDSILLRMAADATTKAYAPYSSFFVGAALRTASGKVITGANQENASFPIGACAERVAIYQLKLLYPGETVVAMAITARMTDREISEAVSPCGSCRQILVELEKQQEAPLKLILMGSKGPVLVFETAGALLPLSFTPDIFLPGVIK